ncbi:MAG: sodium-translocating pyrophosphatase [Patescibacteria group bacterium]|nr:sodium-translocating pyrophosphatase [Patescibacteria group bacterium]
MYNNNLFYLVPVGSVIALFFAYLFYRQAIKQPSGDEKMIKIARAVQRGAIAYLKQQYKVVIVFFIFAAIFFAFLAFVLKVQSPWVPFAFLTGGFFSGLSGYIGMRVATATSSRTAEAAKKSLSSALKIAFRSGAVMGLTVVGLGLLDIALWFIVLRFIFHYDLHLVTTTMLAFGIGASSQALFARVGGGIFTKAADVGADLVGKVEAGIPEDDPRNPAVIADNVGDNVGDVAGMGADLYESYVGSILATAALGAAAGLGLAGVVAPMMVAVVGILASIVGIFLVQAKEEASQKNLLNALSRGINVSSCLIVIFSVLIIRLLLPQNFGIFVSILTGLMVGIVIGKSTEYFTSANFPPTKKIAQASKTGPATVVIEGLSTGMLSTLIPVLSIVVGTILAFAFAGGFKDINLGLYGIGIAAVGMLSTLGITLSTDAYGPIADNAGGNAQMTGQNPEVRKRTDALDALGNTTAATGKGFAIGSAALTALALIAAYIEEVKVALLRVGTEFLKVGEKIIPVKNASLIDFMTYYQIHLLSPKVVSGVMIGAMLAFLFCALTLKAVGRAAGKMVEEVRRQWREIKGIMTGEKDPDYANCVKIVTQAAQREMILPSLLAIIMPIIVGIIFGVAGVVGLLVGALAAGFVLAVMMANAGGAWDNAKKYIEEGNFGGKGSDNHKAAVIGDMLGDPFKDTSGPSLNILIKLMSMVSIVVAGLVVVFSLL